MSIGQKIHDRRTELKLTLEDVGNAVGVGKSTVRKWELGQIANMRRDKISALAQILQMDPTEFIFEEPRYPAPQITDQVATFPVIGDVAAGYDELAIENWDGDLVEIPLAYLHGRPQSDFFVLVVRGDSMYPQYQNGDKVLIQKCDTLDYSGQIGVVIYDDEIGTLKRVEYANGENWLRLVPINPEYPPKTITGEALDHCRVIGKPVLIIREIQQ